jgi:hypothetical protein
MEVSGEPRSHREAMASPLAREWLESERVEIKELEGRETWEKVPWEPWMNVLGSTWSYRIKRDEHGNVIRYKGRFCVQGFSQKYGVDFHETHAGVARHESIRAILALGAALDLEIHNMDVTNAYCQAEVKERIFVRQPEGHETYGPNGEKLVLRLKKSLYGLRQAGYNWHVVVDTRLKQLGFTPNPADPCIYSKVCSNGDFLILALYVDDIIVTGSSLKAVNAFKRLIATFFDMKDLGELTWMLGFQVRRDRSQRTLEITQTSYIDQLLEKYGMADCRPVATPAEGVLPRLTPEEGGRPDSYYMSLVGSLLYAAMVTRPDIAYTVQALGRHSQSSGPVHWDAAKRLLRYLKGTRELGIKYGGHEGPMEQIGFSDSDWAVDHETRRSVTAYLFQLAGGAISWSSKLQSTVALSSTEAELMSACAAAQEAIFLRRLLTYLGIKMVGPTTIYEDNQGAIAMSQNPINHRKAKHIEIRYHFVRERVESQEIKLVYVPTGNQLADLLTKPLPRDRVVRLRGRVLGYEA